MPLLFVYGSLRKGMPLQGYIRAMRGTDTPPHTDGIAQGTMYSFGSYPAVDFDGDGEIVGELYVIPPIDDHHGYAVFRDLVRMETASGYQERNVTVTTNDGTVTATSFHFPGDEAHRFSRGDIVEDGDWVKRYTTGGDRNGVGRFSSR